LNIFICVSLRVSCQAPHTHTIQPFPY